MHPEITLPACDDNNNNSDNVSGISSSISIRHTLVTHLPIRGQAGQGRLPRGDDLLVYQ